MARWGVTLKWTAMPELPEVEITARRLDAALRGAEIESALAPGINALKTFDPPLSALEGRAIAGVGRRGKHLIVEVGGVSKPDGPPPLALLIHLMSAGRLQLYRQARGAAGSHVAPAGAAGAT